MMPTAADAEIILKLYELRREETMRKARRFVSFDFQPTTVEEFREIHRPDNPNNAYWRQVISYWEMTAALALHGAVDVELYADTQGEGFFIRAKYVDFSEAATGNRFMPKTFEVIQRSDTARRQFEGAQKRIADRRIAAK